LALPLTLIHGEFYADNVLVQETTDDLRVCPVDWELTALGPGLIDLAALIAGKWSEPEKRAIALAYYGELVNNHRQPPTVDEFLFALDCCRLHSAIQWLGWSDKWTPSAHQAQNWLGEALRVAESVLSSKRPHA
jgi:aminoglycoside phosphotransferase (APT) family kinase protein